MFSCCSPRKKKKKKNKKGQQQEPLEKPEKTPLQEEGGTQTLPPQQVNTALGGSWTQSVSVYVLSCGLQGEEETIKLGWSGCA